MSFLRDVVGAPDGQHIYVPGAKAKITVRIAGPRGFIGKVITRSIRRRALPRPRTRRLQPGATSPDR